jgi:hypothetical protein
MAIDPAKLRAALAPLRAPPTPAQAERAFGGGTAGRSALAQAIAGTTDKRSTAYRTAMRNLQRYGAGEGKQKRAMGDKLRPLIGQAMQAKRAADRLAQPITVRWRAPTIKVSADSRQRLDFDAELSAAALIETRALLEAGDEAGAMEAFAAASLAQYFGAARTDATITDVEGLTIRPLT